MVANQPCSAKGSSSSVLPASLPSCLSSAPGTCCQSPSRVHYQPFPLDLSCALNVNNSQVSVTRALLLRDPGGGGRGPDLAPATPAHRLHFQGLFIQETKGGKWQEDEQEHSGLRTLAPRLCPRLFRRVQGSLIHLPVVLVRTQAQRAPSDVVMVAGVFVIHCCITNYPPHLSDLQQQSAFILPHRLWVRNPGATSLGVLV